LRIMYTYMCEEASTPELFEIANELMEEVTQMQRETYDLMVEQGWMTPQAQTVSNIEKAYQQLKKVVEEMN
ncbi:MAG: spore coat protein, partial [Traorella sp.]